MDDGRNTAPDGGMGERIAALSRLFEECADVFVAIGDRNRQEILMNIAGAGGEGIDVASLAERFSLSRPAVSHHLKVLKDARIVAARKSGTQVFYSFGMQFGVLEKIKALVLGIEEVIEEKSAGGC